MRIGGFSFQPRLVTTTAAALTLALLASLGVWQANRAEEKRVRQALLEARLREPPVKLTGAVADPEPLLYRRVRASGEWLAERQFFVDNRIHEGQAGFHVVTPLRLDGTSAAVLVDRGWIARDTALYPKAPAVAVPAGHVEVEGLATRPPARVLELSAETIAGDVWQNLSIERYAKQAGLALVPVVILDARPAAGLVAVSERPDAGIEKHVEYSLTWFSLAATVVVLWVALNLKRVR